jgi:mRNA interferase RelE/StbE
LEVTWKVVYKKSVQNDLKKISKDIQYIIKRAIEEKLMIEPLKFGVTLRRNIKGLMKLRVGDYRIIHSINSKIVTIYFIKIGHRIDVYEE